MTSEVLASDVEVAAVAEAFASADAVGHLYAKELGTDGPAVVHRADDPVVLASVFKVAVLIAYARAVAAGELDPRERTTVTARYRIGGVGMAGFADDVEASWHDIASNMMVISDNAATDVLYHRLGDAAVQRVLADLGLEHTRIIGCCEDLFASVIEDLGATDASDVEALLAAAGADALVACRMLDPLQTSASTPRDVARMLEPLWTDVAAPAEISETVRGIMSRQVWPHRLSSGFPDGVTIAAKTGTVPTWRNEAGVVTYPDGRRYVVTVFTRANRLDDRQPAVDASIGRAAFAAVEHLRSLTS